MQERQSVQRMARGAALFLLVCLLVAGLGGAAYSGVYPMGDTALDSETYQAFLRKAPDRILDQLPTSYDARTEGIVTSPKNQGACGSCWAFASVGAFEAHVLKFFSVAQKDGLDPIDYSEQQQVSCNTAQSGCCGGSASAIRYWESKGPLHELCFPYGDINTGCPTVSKVPCSQGSACPQVNYRVIDYYTVPTTAADFKASLYEDGPSYWRWTVYDDFFDYWDSAAAGSVYVNKAASSAAGGHAVLLIGWNDTKGAYLLKNSWGATGGPNGDGTFWFAYSGHAHDQALQMANFLLEVAGGDDWTTAYEGLVGDAETLGTLRAYRDQVLGGSSTGRVLTRMLYKNSEGLLQVLLKKKALISEARGLLAANEGALGAVLKGGRGEIKDTDAVLAFLVRLGAAAPPALKKLVGSVREQIAEHRTLGEPFYGFSFK